MDTNLIAKTLNFRSSQTPVCCQFNHPIVPGSILLNHEATFFNYTIIRGKWYYASLTVGSRASSLDKVDILQSGSYAHGKILEIFQFDQDVHHANQSMWFTWMWWFKPWKGEWENIWDLLQVQSAGYFMETTDGYLVQLWTSICGNWRSMLERIHNFWCWFASPGSLHSSSSKQCQSVPRGQRSGWQLS